MGTVLFIQMFNSIPGHYPVDAKSTLHLPSYDNKKGFQRLPNVSWWEQLRTTGVSQRGLSHFPVTQQKEKSTFDLIHLYELCWFEIEYRVKSSFIVLVNLGEHILCQVYLEDFHILL